MNRHSFRFRNQGKTFGPFRRRHIPHSLQDLIRRVHPLRTMVVVLGVAIRMVTPHVKGNIQVATHQVVAFRRVDHQVEVLLQGGSWWFLAGASVSRCRINVLNDESLVYKAKDLVLVKIETIPVDAAQFRGWKNAFLTKASSIDKTGQNRILQWLLQAFAPDTTREILEITSAELPRLDAHLASVLMDPRHLKGELGLTFQAYAESEQQRGRAPLGRVLLNMIAKRIFLDHNRGANLTQQSLLELDLHSFSHDGLRVFVDRVEYVLNSIPAELQPQR